MTLMRGWPQSVRKENILKIFMLTVAVTAAFEIYFLFRSRQRDELASIARSGHRSNI